MSATCVYRIRPLSNFAIERKLKRLTTSFKGVYDADSLPHKRFAYPWAIIVNTNTDRSASIGHWTAFVFDKNGYGHYFDSYGQPPPHKRWIDYLRVKSRRGVWTQSTIQAQRLDTNTCGYLCIEFILKRLKNNRLTDNKIARSLNEMRAYKKHRLR